MLIAFLSVGCRRFIKPSGWADPVVANEIIVATSSAGELSEISRDDFTRVWRFPGPDDDGIRPEAIYGTPVVTADTVYFGGYDGSVYALGLGSGRLKWDQPFKTEGRIIGGVVLDEANETLFVASDDGRLYGLDPTSGRPKNDWQFKAGGGIWATPLLAEGVLYVPSLDGRLYALDAATGQELWRSKADGRLISNPAISGNTIIVGGIGRRLDAIDAETGSTLWSFKGDNWFWGEALIADGTVYAPSLDSHVYALDLATGSERWSFETQSPVRSRPLLMEGADILVVADGGGHLYGLDLDSGTPMWNAPADLGTTVLSDPVPTEQGVLISAQGGDLFQLNPDTGAVSEVTIKS